MRIRLTLSHAPNSSLPINYAYPISAMIYKMLQRADPKFSLWLHENGWGKDGRKFKLFTFSRLSPTFFRIQGDRIVLLESPTTLTISFLVEDILGTFIEGLFNEQSFSLGDYKSQTDFLVESVDILPKVIFSERMKFKILTPAVVSQQKETDKHAQYLHPINDGMTFQNIFFANLLHKYIAYNGTLDNNTNLHLADTELKILTKPASRLIAIKSGTPQATKIRGYTFGFEVQGPPELLKIGYYAGFGEKGSTGFGFADLW